MHGLNLSSRLNPTEVPSVTSLSVVPASNSSAFTLKCTSTNSPATTIILTKDGSTVAESQYSKCQVLTDGTMATYDSYFNVDADNEDLIGTYSCSVINSAGTSSSDDLNIQGLSS